MNQMKGTYTREAMRRTVGVPTVEGGGWDESEKACESSPPNVDIRVVQSSTYLLLIGHLFVYLFFHLFDKENNKQSK